jgi:nucleoside-diphosphate-sugar epimerase
MNEIKRKKVLVIGATGQLGAYSALALKAQGHEVVAVGHRHTDNGFFAAKGIAFIGGFELEKSESYDKLPADIDAVVHLAGAMPAHSGTSPMPYIQSIIVGMVNLCEWLRTKTNCRRVVFNTTPSDVSQFFNSPVPVKDDAPRSFPKDGGDHAIYAIAKNTAVDILEHYKIAYGISSCIFRHLTVYGYHPDPYYVLNGVRKLLPWRLIMQRVICGETVEVWGDPSRLKELLYIKDFAKAVALATESDSSGIYNLSGDRPYTLDEQIQGLMDVFKNREHPSIKIYCPEKSNTPENLLDSAKARKELHWTPEYNWWRACEDMKTEMENEPMALLWGRAGDYK